MSESRKVPLVEAIHVLASIRDSLMGDSAAKKGDVEIHEWGRAWVQRRWPD